MNQNGLFKLVIILSDGHEATEKQTHGVANWLADFTGCEVAQFNIPKLSKIRNLSSIHKEHILLSGKKEDALEWLRFAKGEQLLRSVGNFFAQNNVRENTNRVLMLSCGTLASGFNLAISAIWRLPCATISMPKILGTYPFEFAIVPEYDFPPKESNVLRTIGIPNNIHSEIIKDEAKLLLANYPLHSTKTWSVIIGKDNGNHRISAAWIKKNIGRIVFLAEQSDADIYMAAETASKEVEKSLNKLKAESRSFRYLNINKENGYDAIPALLGMAQTVFCSDNSLNTVTEAITAGHKIVLLRSEQPKGIALQIQKILLWLIKKGAFSEHAAFGIAKLNIVYDRLKRHDKLVEFENWKYNRKQKSDSINNLPNDGKIWQDFNEAKRAAKWIVESWSR